MPRVPLNQGAYTARSIIANCQRAVNIYPEANPEDSPVKYTHYGAPGLAPVGTIPNTPGRGLWNASSGDLYYVAGSTLYYVDGYWGFHALGTIGSSVNPVSMVDNGVTLVLVDGTPQGYQVNLTTKAFSAISSTTNGPPVGSGSVYGFYGADRVDIIDGYITLNQPSSANMYCTYDNEVVFDALFFAAKNGFSDYLVSQIVSHRVLWLIGTLTSEPWFNAGASPGVPFELTPGPFVQHGCAAKYTLCQIEGTVFFLSQDPYGKNIMVALEGYEAQRISTHAIEQEWANYTVINDAAAFAFQIGGHSFVQINFPTADKSWRYDKTTRLWHEVAWTDPSGVDHRHRVQCATYAYGHNVAADWETGQLYIIDPNTFTDAGAPIYFRRGFPHMVTDGKRVIYPGFTLDIQAATSAGAQISMRWSDDRGATWGQPLTQSLGNATQTYTQVKFWRLGMGRDRVYEIYGTVPGLVALNGAWLDPEPIVMAT